MYTHAVSSTITVRSRSCARSNPGTPQRTSTRVAYERDVHLWRMAGGTIPCTADDLLDYIQKMAHRIAPQTLARRLMAIQDAHTRGGHLVPTRDTRVRSTIRALATGRIPEELLQAPLATGLSPSKAVPPVTATLLEQMLGCPQRRNLLDRRDAAILLLCHAGLKRGAVVALDIGNLAWSPDGQRMLVRTGAQPQRQISIQATGGPLCAVSACREWLEQADLQDKTGPLFVRFSRGGAPVPSGRLDAAYVNKILKKRLLSAGVQDVSMYSAESLRRVDSRGRP